MVQDIGRCLSRRALLDGDRVALVCGTETATFAELDKRVDAAAAGLRDCGVGQGDRVALLMRNSLAFCTLYYAVARLGAMLCPLNWRLAAPEIAAILEDAEASLLIVDDEFAAQAPAFGPSLLTTQEFETRCRPPGSAEGAWPTIFRDDPLLLVYTSGTTGAPKGVVLTHGQMLWTSITMAATLDYHGGDVSLIPVPLFHVGGLSMATIFVHLGASAVLLPAWEPGRVLEIIAKHRVNHFFAVAAMLQTLLDEPVLRSQELGSLRWIMAGGAPVPLDLIVAFDRLGIPLLQTFGATETGGPATVVPMSRAMEKAGSVGQPFFHTDIRVVADDGSDMAPGETGEILIGGPHIASEYWRNPEASAEALGDGWYRSGDVGRLDGDGFLYIVDRKKDVIISGGENIYPAEIERVLAGHPDISEVAVVGVPDRHWGEVACAVVVAGPASTITLDTVRDFCAQHLAAYKIPRKLLTRETPLPRNATGKLLKARLREELAGCDGD